MATGLENLKVYQKAKSLSVDVFNLTKDFPKEEAFSSVSQLRRSSASVVANIAESYHRQSVKDKIRILQSIAKGEAEEVRSHLTMCYEKKLHYNKEIIEAYTELLKMLSGYITFLQKNETVGSETSQLKTLKLPN